jgi:hypothetical protein
MAVLDASRRMKKKLVFLFVCLLIAAQLFPQRTFLVEKIGTSTRYAFHTDDRLKLRVSREDTLLKGRLLAIGDSEITLSGFRPHRVMLTGIGSVYKQFYFPRKLGYYLAIGSAGIFGIITINHLLNNEQVFTPDMFILTGSLAAGSLISFYLSERRCRIGVRWKIKILDVAIN